jgi:hypothetical protein
VISYTITIADGPHLFDVNITEPTRDPDTQRQTMLFFQVTYTAGVVDGQDWWPPHTIRTIKWKEVEE